MMEKLGVFGRYGKEFFYYIEDGVLKRNYASPINYRQSVINFKKEIGRRFMGDEDFWVGISDDLLVDVLNRCVRKPISVLQEEAAERVARRKKVQDEEAKREAHWQSIKQQFGGLVIGVCRHIDIYDSGFSVRVLFRSDSTYEDRKNLVFNRKKEILRWAMGEIKNNPLTIKRIGDLRYYRPSEIIMLRMPEMEIKFDVKTA